MSETIVDPGVTRRPAATTTAGRAAGRRRRLWLGFAAVVAPLAVLLALQYLWLVDLQRSSSIARRATMDKYLGLLLKEVHYVYGSSAERTLNLPSQLLEQEKTAAVGAFFAKRDVELARRLFVVSFAGHGETLFYDRGTRSMVVPKVSDEAIAVWAATAPFKYAAKLGTPIAHPALSVDERDPEHRILLNPITDERWRLVGLAGMILDREVFEARVLPAAVASALPRLDGDDALSVTVRAPDGRRVLPAEAPGISVEPAAKRSLGFVFTDYVVELGAAGPTPEQWARANFALNLSLSLTLALALLAGILLALRTALREMRLSAMKNEFVSNVSHELRTPLASIRVFGEFMRLGRVTEPEKVREYGEFIETESRRLTQLVNNILDFSRIESGRRTYAFEPADLAEVVAGTLSALEFRLRAAGTAVEYTEPEDPLPMLPLDAAAIDQAVANLLDNAVKYGGESNRIEVAVRRAGAFAEVAVADHGIGIPRAEQERIFERFHRVGTDLVHDVRGSGLGLALVRHIVEAHGGTVAVDSQPGSGSTFTIRLPIPEGAT